ncbi:hypothetical protein NEHOM01_1396 [Nematocida homosporus]|uniref:uncharacterized protein n=1 Tax=Nematocida homosporus TaxID=1912981 RepID=UPI0022209E4E|nr:uncharacterized protein NEHOM01_1396 [Nematocida homosporus]KAI5186332.1 hypothetical protein NEHOM01_1396 [Nematocida homosporus]
MRKKHNEERLSKRVRRESVEESESETVHPPEEPQVLEASNLHPFSIITAAFYSFIRLLGSARRVHVSSDSTGEGNTGEDNLADLQDNSEGSGVGSNTGSTTDDETRRTILSIIQGMFGGAGIGRREMGLSTGASSGSSVNSQDFELLLHQMPSSYGQDPSSIVFTVIYYIGEEEPRVKTMKQEDLDKASPEKTVDEPQGECPICLEEIETGAVVRRLVCSHMFHSSCIAEWLTQYANECPMCRTSTLDGLEKPVEDDKVG